MSKLMDALTKAEEDRQCRKPHGTPPTPFIEQANGIPVHVIHLGGDLQPPHRVAKGDPALSSAIATPSSPEQTFALQQAPASQVGIAQLVPFQLDAPHGTMVPSKHGRDGFAKLSVAGAEIVGTALVNGSVAAFDQALGQLRRQAMVCEGQVAQQVGEQVRLTSQLAAGDQLIATLEHDRTTLRTRLAKVTEHITSLQQTKASSMKQWEALQACQGVAHDVAMTQQALEANAAMMTHLIQSQQRVANDLTSYQQWEEALKSQLAQLHHRLEQTLALTGTQRITSPQQKERG